MPGGIKVASMGKGEGEGYVERQVLVSHCRRENSSSWGIGPERRELDIVECEWLDWVRWSASYNFTKAERKGLALVERAVCMHTSTG